MPQEDNNKLHRKRIYYTDEYFKRRAESRYGKRKETKPVEKREEPIVKEINSNQNNQEKESIIKEVKEILELKSGLKWEKTLIVIIYSIALLLILYFIVASFFPDKLPFSDRVYTIDAKDARVFDSLKSFYIDSNVLGDKEDIDGKQVRIINSAKPFNLVFVPKINVKGKNSTLTLTLSLNGTGSNIYLDNKLVFPSLDNYTKIYENTKDYIYSRDGIEINTLKEDVNSSEEFIYRNLAGVNVWSTRILQPVNIKLEDYKQQETPINTTFRDNLKLAVYAGGNLNINFTKQDLNSYVGQDEYMINITDQLGNVVFSQVYEDDGDKSGSRNLGKEQNFEINLNVPNGIYHISFIKDDYNQYADSTIKSIRINSNKIVIIETFLPYNTLEIYTKSNINKVMGFSFWNQDKHQKINITGTINKTINLSNDWREKKYFENLTTGEYIINLEKGYLWVYSDVVSPKKENWFELPAIQQENFNNQNFLVLSRDIFNKGKLKLIQNITVDEKTKKTGFRILDANKVYFESAKLEID